MYRTVKTSELRLGDVVNCHGMRCLIDREIFVSKGHGHLPDTSPVRYTSALVLNRDEVSPDLVPLSFTRDRNSRGHLLSDDARWTIQGNDLARWAVEVETPAEYLGRTQGSRRGGWDGRSNPIS